MSELQQQVSRFREENLVDAPVYSSTPSLFLNKKDAGSVDMETVFDAGLAGLQALSQYDERFTTFMENIFHPSSLSVQRDLLAPEETKILNRRISDLLRVLTLFSGEPSAHKVLEYLVRRYKVHELNVDALMRCMIAQHDTKIFARIVQLSKIDNTIWSFLSSIKASGLPLARATLAKRCRKDTMLLTAVTSLAMTAVRTGNASLQHQQRNGVSSLRGAEAVVSFYTATVVEMLEAAHSISEAQLRVLYPFLIGGLGGEVSGDEQTDAAIAKFGPCTSAWKKAACMLVSEVVRLVHLGKPMLRSLMDTIASSVKAARSVEYGVDTDVEDLLMAFTMLAQYQKVMCSPCVLSKLFLDDMDMSISTDLLEDLDSLACNYSADVGPVIAAILDGVVASLLGTSAVSSSATHDDARLSPKEFGVIFLRVSAAGLAGGEVVLASMGRLLEGFVGWEGARRGEQKKEGAVAAEYRVAVEDILRACSQRYPSEFDSAVQAVMASFNDSKAETECVSALLKHVFEKSPYKLPNEAGVGLLLGLGHTSSKLRVEALQLLGSSLPLEHCAPGNITSDVMGLCSAALVNFDGTSDLKVLVAACQVDVLTKVTCALPAADFFEALSGVIAVLSERIASAPKHARTALVAVLTGVFNPSVLEHIGHAPGAGETLLLLLFSTLQLCRHTLPRTEKASKYCRDIIAAVSMALVNLSDFSILLTKCKDSHNYEAMTDIDEMCDACWTVLSSAMATNISKHGFDGIQALLGLYESLKSTSEVTCGLAALIALLSSVCEQMVAANKKKQIPGIIQQTFSVLLSWVTFFYEHNREADSLSRQVDESLAACLLLAQTSDVFPEQISPDMGSQESMGEIMAVYKEPVLSSGASARLLVSLLELMGSDAERATPLIGLVVHTFYATSPIKILAQIGSCSGGDDEEIAGSMEESYSNSLELDESISSDTSAPKACLVSSDARTSALYTLSAYLRFALDDEGRDESFLSELLSLLPSTIICLGDDRNPVRVAALTIIDELCDLTSEWDIKISTGEETVTYSSALVAYLSQLYRNKSNSIVVDGSISLQVLEDDIFQSDNAMGAELAQLFLHVALALGWKSPLMSNFILTTCLQKSESSVTWRWVKQLLLAAFDDELTDDAGVQSLGITLLRVITWNVTESTSDSEKKDIITTLCLLLPLCNSAVVTFLRSSLLSELSSLSLADSAGPRWLDHIGEAGRVQLFSCITAEMVGDGHTGSRDDFVSGLQAIPVPVDCVFDTLVACQAHINEHLAIFEASEGETMDVQGEDEEDMEEGSTSLAPGLALPLQHMCMYLDSISPVLQRASGEQDFQHLSKAAVILIDILISLNMPQISTVLTIGYCRGLLLDLACTCMGKIRPLMSQQEPLSKGVKGKKSVASKPKKGAVHDVYPLSRVDSDIEATLQCLQLSSTSYVQTFSLRLFDILLSLKPSSVDTAVRALSYILASATSSKSNISCDNSNGLVGGIIRTTTAIRARKFGDVSSQVKISYPQEVLAPLYSNFSVMTFDKRLALMKTAFQEFDDNSLPTSIALILAHSLAVYGSNRHSHSNSVTRRKSKADTAENENGDVFILLSRAAQRKANASRKVSESEEFFSLATKASFLKPTSVQMQSLVVLTRIAKNLLTFLVKDEVDLSVLVDEEEQESLKIDGQVVTAEDEMLTQMDDYNADASKSVFSLSKYVSYANRLLRSNTIVEVDSDRENGVEDEGESLEDTSSNGAALTILMMEYILEFVENTKFHEAIISTFEESGSSEGGEEAQRLFLVLCEQLLELLAFSTHIQHSLAHCKTLLPIRLGGTDNGGKNMDVRPSAIAKRVWMLSLDAIHAIQRLLDGPTFIVILQELMNHEHVSVRQKSLQILGDRLRLVSGTKRAQNDSALYLDLASQLLESVRQAVPSAEDSLAVFSASSDSDAAGHELVGQLGIAQSALLGIDILARQFSSAKEWASPMTKALGELVGMAQAVADTIHELPVGAAVTQEVFKLLGSFYLSCGTLCSAAKVRALPFLESLLGRMLGLLESQGAVLLQFESSVEADEVPAASARSQCRTLTLLIRSCVAAVASMVTDLSSFFHPYMPRFLEAVTPLQSLKHTPDAPLLSRDIEQCLYVITTKVPSRLSIPAILQASLNVFTNKQSNSQALLHSTAAKLASFQYSNWENLDRASVSSHLDSLQSISLVGLNYRYTSGDQSPAGDDVDTEVCTACIEFCLKLTETELREFIVQLVDMKDNLLVDSEAPPEEKYADWRIFSRSSVFYQLLSGLNSKLKHIFVPLMGLVWQGAADHLSTFIDFVKVMKPNMLSESSSSSKKSKKRKLLELSSSVKTGSEVVQQQVLRELVTGCGWVLKSVRKCCVNDNVNFVDQYQYETIIRQMSTIYAMREAFSSDAEYLAFAGDLVLPCIVQLVIAVGRDLLWKSLNHDVLVMMRSSQKSVKIASLRGLQKLFTDVGEEYLILLPECLPFLSEILEDGDSGVVALASQVIQSIEDLSGESLDSYLR